MLDTVRGSNRRVCQQSLVYISPIAKQSLNHNTAGAAALHG